MAAVEIKTPVVTQTALPIHVHDPAQVPASTPAVSTETNSKSTIRPAFQIEEHPIDQVRPIKVGVIGGGLSGITAGILLPVKLPGLNLQIYDKNSDLV